MGNSNIRLSQFAHVFANEDIKAIYHSLGLKPIFVSSSLYNRLQEYLEGNGTIDFELETFIEALKKLKILVADQTIDDQLLLRLRSYMPEPYTHMMYMILAESCNLSCSYCFVRDKSTGAMPSVKLMSKETAKRALDYFCFQISRDQDKFKIPKQIIFYGGEPLLNYSVLEYILPLIEDYKKKGVLPEALTLSMVTNGTLLNGAAVELLKKHGVEVGISLDGSTLEENSCRVYRNNRYAYPDIIKGIELATEANLPISLSVTLTENTINNPDGIHEITDRYNIKTVGFNILMTDKDFSVSQDYNEKASGFIIRAFEKFRKKDIYEDRMMRKISSFVSSQIYWFDCGAQGANQVVIAPNGDIGICHGCLSNRRFFAQKLENEFVEVSKIPEFAEWGKRTPINMDKCRFCVALGICGGGCPTNAANNSISGSIWELDERFCVHSKKTLEWMIWDLYAQSCKSESEVTA